MKLFEIDDNYQVRPNKVWIALIPEFNALLKRDKGSEGDSEGRKKLQARKEFVFIYFYCDFASPLRDYQPEEKQKEALSYAQLEQGDLDKGVWAAVQKYDELQLKAARSLRTYRNMLKGLDAMDKHFEVLNFDERDKLGRVVNTPEDFAASILKMNKVYDEFRKFEKRVDDDLKNSDAGIRGNASLGDNETKRSGMNSTWNEADIGRRSEEVSLGLSASTDDTDFEDSDEKSVKALSFIPKFEDLTKLIHKVNKLSDDQIDSAIVLDNSDVKKEKP